MDVAKKIPSTLSFAIDADASNARVITSSSDEVIELLGEHGRQKATVNQVLSAIGNFQSGHINGTFLKGTSEPIVHIRAGKYRIFLKRRNGRTYAVKEIKNRGEAY